MQPSSPRNPCPICGRDDSGGDCRIRPDGAQVLCHYGSSFHPPAGLKPGAVITGKDGRQWAFAGPSSDERTAVFVIDQPSTNGSHPPRSYPPRAPQPMASHSPAPLPPNIELALLSEPAPTPPARWPSNHELIYSDSQKAVVSVKPDGGKSFYVHSKSGEQWARGAGADPWPLYRQNEACSGGQGKWVIELEGEKCAEWVRAAGAIAISQPGHAHRTEQITPRYRALFEAGVAGVVYISDNDKQGRKRAEQSQQAAGEVGLPWLHLPAGSIWPEIPEGGSIDDASGPPADRLQAIRAAIPLALQQRTNTSEAQPEGDEKTSLTKIELQQFVTENFQVEWNELRRDVELNGVPMGANRHLADTYLASTCGLNVSKQAAADCFEYVARSNPYNPVRRYLQGLRHRTDLQLIPMEELAAAFAIKPHDHLSQSLLARHLAAAVRRGMEPGYKHDQFLVIRGGQGTGKSQSIAALAGPWFDSATRVEDLEHREFLARFNSAWLFEFDECEHTLLKRTASEFKGFLSRAQDRYVEKYEKAAMDHPRRSIAFGTTNQSEFLNDHTGNRRAWVIDVGNQLLDPAWIAANRDSIWATVLTWVDWGLITYIPAGDPLLALVAERANDAQLSDMWETTLADYITRHTHPNGRGIAQDDLAKGALGLTDVQLTRDIQMRITRVVTGEGFRTHDGQISWKSDKRRFNGGPPRAGYVPLQMPVVGANAGSCSDEPTSPTETSPVGSGVGSDHSPWQNSDLSTLFQTFQPFISSSSSKSTGGTHDTPRARGTGLPEKLEQVGTLEHPSCGKGFQRSDSESVPRSERHTPENHQQCRQNESRHDDIARMNKGATSGSNVDPATAGGLPVVGALIDVRTAPDQPWQPGYLVEGIDDEHLRLRSPHTKRSLNKSIAGQGRTWRHVA